MRLSITLATAAAIGLLLSPATAFAPASMSRQQSRSTAVVSLSAETAAMADSGVPATESTPSESVADAEIPTVLPSDMGVDYVPLATMLATGQLAEADQVSW